MPHVGDIQVKSRSWGWGWINLSLLKNYFENRVESKLLKSVLENITQLGQQLDKFKECKTMRNWLNNNVRVNIIRLKKIHLNVTC